MDQVGTNYKFIVGYPRHQKAERQAGALIAAAELDVSELVEADVRAHMSAKHVVSQMRLGMFETPYR